MILHLGMAMGAGRTDIKSVPGLFESGMGISNGFGSGNGF